MLKVQSETLSIDCIHDLCVLFLSEHRIHDNLFIVFPFQAHFATILLFFGFRKKESVREFDLMVILVATHASIWSFFSSYGAHN